MTHLNIQQGSGVEIVSALIIKKLYDIALTVSEPLEGETDAAYMSGNLLVDKTSRKARTYLTTRFPNLHINVTGDYYIDFEDSILGNRLVSLCSSDGVGVTETDAANATFTQLNLNDLKNDVTSFNEFGYFTKANSNWGNLSSRFRDFRNLTSIDLTNLQYLRGNDFRNTGITTINAPSLIGVGYLSGSFAFQDCTSLTTVQSFGSITVVPESCFRGCTSLTTFPFDNITEIKGDAFRLCTNLTTINLPSLTSLSGSNTFYGCTNLTTVTSLGSITSIPTNTFRNCTSLSSINIPNTVTSYGESSFRDCTSLYATIDLTGVTNIGVEPFVGSNVSFTGNTSSITTLGNGAFKNSSISGNLSFPTLTTLGRYVFENCTGITKISNLGSVQVLDSVNGNELYGIFNGCTSLTEVIFPTTLKRFSFGIFGTLLNTVGALKVNKFIFPYGMEEGDVPRNVGSVDVNYMQFPSTITSIDCIGANYNTDSSNINMYIVVQATTIPSTGYTSNGSFTLSGNRNGHPEFSRWYVPDAKLNDYKAHADWAPFASSIFPISQLETDNPTWWAVYQANKDYGVPSQS